MGVYLGMRYTAGLVKRKNIIGQFDADVVALMRKAGGIILAVTNVSELCMWWESNNNVYGRSRNPYDIHRIVGGSSGGEVLNHLFIFHMIICVFFKYFTLSCLIYLIIL